MNGRPKKIRIRLVLVCIVVIILAMIPVIKMNQQYPEVKKVMIEKGRKNKLKKGVCLTVQETKWMNRTELEKQYTNTIEMIENRDYKAVFVKVILENETDKEQKYPIYNLYLESDIHYYNGVDMDLYTAIEENPTAEIILKPKQKQTVILPYSISDVYFEKGEWNTLERNIFYLVAKRYPNKNCWEI